MTASRVALVTGGGGGLGSALGRTLVGAGWKVALLGRREAPLAAARDALGDSVRTFVADVTDRQAVESAVKALEGEMGAPAALVNAAGVATASGLLPPDDELWGQTLAVNATGPWIVTTAVLPGMVAAGGGSIVNVASTAAIRGFRYAPAYVTAKHALLGLTRALAEDLVGRGVRVNAVCPGFLDTPMTARSVARIVEATGRSAAEARATLAALNASGRLITPDEVAAVILDVLGDETRTGEAIVLE